MTIEVGSTRSAKSVVKELLGAGYSALLSSFVYATARSISGTPRVWYGGAWSGNVGGPRVKVKRLLKHFPEAYFNYNLAYLLSNAPHLTKSAIKVLKQRGVSIVHNQNGVFYAGWYAGDWEAQNRRMAHSYHLADWVFYQSDFCKRVADKFLGKRDAPGEILYNAVDTGWFTPRLWGNELPKGGYCFLVTGKFDRHLYYRLESTIKGLRIACDSGLDARIKVAGWIDGQARACAERLASGIGLASRVEFIGEYTQEEAPEIYRSADAYIMTKYLDPCPNTVLEAMASGLPVLYSASGGVAELVGPLAGIGLPVEECWDGKVITPTSEEIGHGMVEIVRRGSAMGVAARLRAVTKFEASLWVERHRQVFQRLLEAKN